MSRELPSCHENYSEHKDGFNDEEFEERYKLELVEKYSTRCACCRAGIRREKDATVCGCGLYWLCSPRCLQRWQDDYEIHSTEKCRSEDRRDHESKVGSINDFLAEITVFFNSDTAKTVEHTIGIYSKDGLTRSAVKAKAERGDAMAAFIIGLTYQFRFVCEREETELAILPPFERSRPFTNGKAIKYHMLAAEADPPSREAVYALGQLIIRFEKRSALDYFDRVIDYLPAETFLYYSKELFSLITENLDEIEWFVSYQNGSRTDYLCVSGLGMEIYLRYFSKGSSKNLEPKLPGTYQMGELTRSLKKLRYLPDMMIRIEKWVYDDFVDQSPRSIENILYKNTAVSNNSGTWEDVIAVNSQVQKISKLQLRFICEHGTDSIGNSCLQCGKEANFRIQSVYMNSYFLSKTETVYGSHYSVIYLADNGVMKEELFRNYSKCEIKFVLNAMKQRPHDIHVLKIAKNPDFYWPVIIYFGSVYSALKETAGECVAEEVYSSRRTNFIPHDDIRQTYRKLFPSNRQDRTVILCGNPGCTNLDIRFCFLRCSRCKIRRYCSPDCQKKDWAEHKLECYLRVAQKSEEELNKAAAKEEMERRQKIEMDMKKEILSGLDTMLEEKDEEPTSSCSRQNKKKKKKNKKIL